MGILDKVLPGVGVVTSLASVIANGIASRKKNQQAQNALQEQQKRTKAWYENEKASEYSERNDVKAILKKQKELLDDRYNNAKGTAAVMGSGLESVALEKNAATSAISDTATEIAGRSAAYQQGIDAQKIAADQAAVQQEAGILTQQGQAITDAASTGVAAGLNAIASMANSEGDNKPQDKTQNRPNQILS